MDKELTITYNGAERGESIILEWPSAKKERMIGIIDSGRGRMGKNAAIEFVQTNSIKIIEFILLSHPHYNKYSGMLDLIEYCEKENILIRNFFHTSHLPAAGFESKDEFERLITIGSFTESSKRLLLNLFFKLNEMYKKGMYVAIIGSDFTLSLNKDLKLSILSPSYTELTHAYKINYTRNSMVRAENNPAANYLSTVTRINTSEWQVLFTSDAMRETFQRILGEDNVDLFAAKTVFFEAPHHGSQRSFDQNFWSRLNIVSDSIGVFTQNRFWDYPNKEVIDYFSKKSKVFILQDRLKRNMSEIEYGENITAITSSAITVTISSNGSSILTS